MIIDSVKHLVANEWRSCGGVAGEAERGRVRALRNRYIARQLVAKACHIQHRQHNLEWRSIPTLSFLAGNAIQLS